MRGKNGQENGQLWFNFDAPQVPANRQSLESLRTFEAYKKLEARFVAGDLSALSEAWLFCAPLVDKQLSKEFAKNRVLLILQDRDDMRHDILCNFFTKYKRNPNYRVRKSIIAELYNCLRNRLYHPRKIDKLIMYSDNVELLQAMKTKQE